MESQTNTNNVDLTSELPPELLGQIFTHCLPSETVPISSKVAPLLFLQVCRRWREIAYLTPSLWQLVGMGSKFKGDPIFIFDLFLKTSGNLPLTIILPYPRHPKLALHRYQEFVNRVLDNLHRVSAMKGHFSSSFPFIIFNRLAATVARGGSRHLYAPLLKRLDISGFDLPPQVSQKEFTEYLSGCIIAPNIENIDLNTSRIVLSMISTSSLIPESLKTLTGLYITDVAQVTDLSFLSQACNLTTFEFCVYDTYEESLVLKLPSSIHLPNLKELHFSLIGTRYTEIIRSLHLPCLEKLSISVRMGPPLSNIIQLLTKGETPPLRSLSLGGWDAVPTLQCFTDFKEVEELKLLYFPSGRWLEAGPLSLLEKIQGHDLKTEFKLFPQLSSVVVRSTTIDAADYEIIRKILWDRSILNGGKLTCAKFLNCKFISSDDKEALQALSSEMDGQLNIEIVVDEESPF